MGKKKIAILLCLASVLLGLIFIPGYIKIRNLSQQNKDLERQIDEVRQANRELQQEQEKLLNDPIYLEKVAREKLGVVREGEVIYKVLPPQKEQ